MIKRNFPMNLVGPRKKKARKALMRRYNKVMQAMAKMKRNTKLDLLCLQGYQHKLKLIDTNKGCNTPLGITEKIFEKLIA